MAAFRGITVPPEVKAKFGVLVDLILGSESMNEEERQYWIDVLPTMNTDQVGKLQDILHNERQQLSAIDQAYKQESAPSKPAIDPEVVKAKRSQRQQQEHADQTQESTSEEEVLKQIQNL